MEPFAAWHVSGLARTTMSGAAAAVSFRLAPGFGTFGARAVARCRRLAEEWFGPVRARAHRGPGAAAVDARE